MVDPGRLGPEQVPASRWPAEHAAAVVQGRQTVSVVAVAAAAAYEVGSQTTACLQDSWAAWR